MMASVITSGLFKAGQRLTCQKSACASNRNTMRSLNIAIGGVSSGLFFVCWAQRIYAKGCPVPLDRFPLSRHNFPCLWVHDGIETR
jgi:hypothetical protein